MLPTIGKRTEEVHKTVSAKSLDIPKELWYVVVLTRKGDENYGKQTTCRRRNGSAEEARSMGRAHHRRSQERRQNRP